MRKPKGKPALVFRPYEHIIGSTASGGYFGREGFDRMDGVKLQFSLSIPILTSVFPILTEAFGFDFDFYALSCIS